MKPTLLPLLLLAPFALAVAPVQDDDVWTQKELEAITRKIQGDVEALRGVEFKRPVAVSLTDKEGFMQHLEARIEKLAPEGMLANDEATAKLLGLIPPDMDMWKVMGAMLEGSVGGFYDPGQDTFYLMKSYTGKVAEIILSHELTHALDDQYFDIDAGFVKTLDDSDASMAYGAVVEGSGTALMSVWMMQHVGELGMEALQAASDMGTESMDGAPPYLWKPMLASYIQGQSFLQAGYKHLKKTAGGDLNDAVTQAFQNPPLSSEQVLHPNKYWKADQRDDPRKVVYQLGQLPEGWARANETVLGELVLALVVAEGDERAPFDSGDLMAMAFPKFGNKAAAGWGGDRALLLTKEGASALHVATYWDDADEAQEFRAALLAQRAAIEEGLAAMDSARAGSGFVLRDGEPEEVSFLTWSGASEDEIERVLAAVRYAADE